MSPLPLAATLALLAGPSLAQGPLDLSELEGVYQRPGMSCTVAAPGAPGGPVQIDAEGLAIAGISCSFTARTTVSRMDAMLVDALCRIDGRPEQTRFLINRGSPGITLISRELGTFVFEKCM